MPNRVEFKDYYDVLGVDRKADEKAVRAAYRQRAKEMHPDVNRDDPKAEEQFKDLNEAYEVLSNADRRAMYDRFGEDWKRYKDAGVSPDDVSRTSGRTARPAGGSAANQDFGSWFAGDDGQFTFEGADNGGKFSDFFTLLFGDRGQPGARPRNGATRPRRGDDLEAPTTITLEEAATGTQRRLSVRAPQTCTMCHGSGEMRGGMCPRCDGRGTTERIKELEVSIPRGVRTGSRVRITGKGGPGMNGGPNGDVYLVIKVVPHPHFERSGDDLIATIQVPLYTALLGGEVIVPTMGKSVALSIPAGTQAGKQFRLRGKGMPKLGGPDTQYGDLVVKCDIALPTDLTAEERALVERLRVLRS